MVLIIGGAYQGKGEFALKLADGDEDRILFNVHDRIEAGLRAGRAREEIEAELLSEISGREELILTADEVGCGIVPADAVLRECREVTGRILCALAGEAGEVYRMVAGIPVKIKG
ncbi:MAG: adenosylcobinamide kinase [Lachnospiraceae bacterium]|nr:adenosylcobinamide kinase [Lachnospiraceae bacterium]